MKQKKIIKIAAITIHALAFILGVFTLGLILCVFAKADVDMIANYIAVQTKGEYMPYVTRQKFLEALQLCGIYKYAVTACCLGLGACVCSLTGNILGIVSNFESKNDRLAS